MRPLADIQKRWATIFENSIGVDLRTSVREGDGVDPCEAGLRSVCWKSFLLYGPVSQSIWPKKLAESRNAYLSLRDHFLRFVDHPDDLHSTADPLADDETSPWSTFRQDEEARVEIFQDVTRTHQDNYFFKEPETQKRLLDVLFIYSKLNPDTGYRQGMHELLAPLLWVINHDAVDEELMVASDREIEGASLMIETLNRKWIEADAFSLFCAVMQNAKASYETGEGKDSSPIVARSRKIHDDLLAIYDPELALHLQVVGVLPQIYAIRWIRLLFGREFDFKDVLRLWDILFAENVQSSVIDLTCVALLLRMRWDLVEADYSTAITTLTRVNMPNGDQDPRSLVRDAIYLDRNKTSDAGADLIQRTSGRRPKVQRHDGSDNDPVHAEHPIARGLRTPQHRQSASPSPARFSSPQKQLETIFQNVSGGIQQRAEGWNVSKAVRSAVGEVRKNMNSIQTHSKQPSTDVPPVARVAPRHEDARSSLETKRLERRLRQLESRNKALAKMLDGALDTLRLSHATDVDNKEEKEANFNISLAKIQFVSVYLADPEIPIPMEEEEVPAPGKRIAQLPSEKDPLSTPANGSKDENAAPPPEKEVPAVQEDGRKPEQGKGLEVQKAKDLKQLSPSAHVASSGPPTRPSLADSSFSFMLGENQHRSNFVSSVAELPEQRRGSQASDLKPKPKQLWTEEEKKKAAKDRKAPKDRKGERKGSESEDDGFTMNSLRGGQATAGVNPTSADS